MHNFKIKCAIVMKFGRRRRQGKANRPVSLCGSKVKLLGQRSMDKCWK